MILLKAAATSGGPEVFGVSTVEFVGAAIGTTSATIPAHIAGDLIIGFGSNFADNTVPNVPGGWTSIHSGGGSVDGDYYMRRVAWRVASDSSTVSGTWTNSQTLIIVVLRGQLSVGTPVISRGSLIGKTSTITYGIASPFTVTDRTSSLLFFGRKAATSTTLDTPPRWCTNEWAGNSGSSRGVVHMSNAGIAAYSDSLVSVVTGGQYHMQPLEILSEP